MTLFGFGYDEDFLKVLGEPWPGVREADRRLEGEALASGRSVDEIRAERQPLYDRWLAVQARRRGRGRGGAVVGTTSSSGG